MVTNSETSNPAPKPKLAEIAQPNFCPICGCAIWWVLSRHGFELRLDGKKMTRDWQIANVGKPAARINDLGETFSANFRTETDILLTKGQGVVLKVHNCKTSDFQTELPNPKSYFSNDGGF